MSKPAPRIEYRHSLLITPPVYDDYTGTVNMEYHRELPIPQYVKDISRDVDNWITARTEALNSKEGKGIRHQNKRYIRHFHNVQEWVGNQSSDIYSRVIEKLDAEFRQLKDDNYSVVELLCITYMGHPWPSTTRRAYHLNVAWNVFVEDGDKPDSELPDQTFPTRHGLQCSNGGRDYIQMLYDINDRNSELEGDVSEILLNKFPHLKTDEKARDDHNKGLNLHYTYFGDIPVELYTANRIFDLVNIMLRVPVIEDEVKVHNLQSITVRISNTTTNSCYPICVEIYAHSDDIQRV